MGKGGARSNSGPPPDMNALARVRDGKEWTRLPGGGRRGPTPSWPREVEPADHNEELLWERLWCSPQALVWEADQVHNTVALYVRTWLRAMQKDCPGTVLTHAKTLASELMLTPDSLARGKYVITGTAEAAALEAAVARHPAGNGAATGTEQGGARSRGGLTVVPTSGPLPLPAVDQDDDEADDDAPPF